MAKSRNIGLGPEGWTPEGLVKQIKAGPLRDSELVRVTATWITRAHDLQAAPDLTGLSPRLTAWVCASVNFAAYVKNVEVPSWTRGHELDTFWHPGPRWAYAYTLAHADPDYFSKGILMDADSLRSV